MTKEQREAVEVLRRLPSFDMDELLLQILDGAGLREASKALNTLVAMLTPPDENHRLAIVAVRNPGLSRIKGTCEECQLFKRCKWAIEGTRFGVALDHRTFRPSDGCPWKEEKA